MATSNQEKQTRKSTSRLAEETRAAAALAKAEAAKAKVEAAKAKTTIIAKGQSIGFVNFIREQGVVGLAVGLAIGTAAGDTVRKLVEGFITPIVQFIVGSQDSLATAHWVFKLGDRVADFKWGPFVSSLITLIATAFVIYLIVHYLKFDRIDKKKG